MRLRRNHAKKVWLPETLELGQRCRRLLCKAGYPNDHSLLVLNPGPLITVHWCRRSVNVLFDDGSGRGQTTVYQGHDDLGPYNDYGCLREQLRKALIVLRQYMILDDLANV